MLEVFQFIIDTVFGMFNTLDSIVFFGNISLLKIIIIMGLFTFILSILFKKGGND